MIRASLHGPALGAVDDLVRFEPGEASSDRERLSHTDAGQWLEIRNLDSVKPDPQKFREWGPELREAMRTETRLFFDHILRENRPLTDFLSALT